MKLRHPYKQVRSRITTKLPIPAVPNNPEINRQYLTKFALSVDIDQMIEFEILNKVLLTASWIVFTSLKDESQSGDYATALEGTKILEIRESVPKAVVTQFFSPWYNDGFDDVMNARVAYDLSKRLRMAFNTIENGKPLEQRTLLIVQDKLTNK